jgi:hypothetical protein
VYSVLLCSVAREEFPSSLLLHCKGNLLVKDSARYKLAKFTN